MCENPFQLWLLLSNSTLTCELGIGVDFVFPRKNKEEGRKEGRNILHLASSRRNDPTCLNFGECLVGVWRVFGNCLEGAVTGVRWIAEGCLEGAWKVRVSGGYLWGIHGMS